MQVAAVAGSDPNKQREYLKKKKQRKLQRFKELEEERELEKNKWLAFTNKVSPSLYLYAYLLSYSIYSTYVSVAVLEEGCHKEEHLRDTGERERSCGNWYVRRQRSGNDKIQQRGEVEARSLNNLYVNK